MADDQTIILHHTDTDNNTPALLYAGEIAAAVGPTYTKMWVGDGAVNRLLLSSNRLELAAIGAGRSTITVADVAPVGQVIGDLWCDGTTGNLFIWFSSQWVQV